MKKLSLMALGAILIFSACKKEGDSEPDPSITRAMFINATVGADTIRVRTNDTIAYSGLNFSNNTGYMNFSPGNRHIEFLLQSSGLPLKDITQNLVENRLYSVFSAGVINNPEIVIINDDLTPPSAGNAKVRFVNLSAKPDMSVNVWVGQDSVANNISVNNASGFTEIPEGNKQVLAQDPTDPPGQKNIPNYEFKAGAIYTIILTGSPSGAGIYELKLAVIKN